MKIIFEDYLYDSDVLCRILPKELLSFSSDEKLVKTTYVGYFYSKDYQDAFFILPKVFIDSNGRPFGKDLTKEYFIENRNLTDWLGEIDAQIVSRLSFWLYMAIARYAERNCGTEILMNRDIQEIKSVGEYDCTTLIEIIQSLRKFNRDHQSLFTFIAKYNRSGINNIYWGKTICSVLPYLQDDTPVYLDFVNKKKNINFDEELIVLFYSVLEYLKEKYFFEETINLNYNLIPVHEIDALIEAEMGTIMLNKIRHKYFTDELVQLWNLLYVFFDKAERIATKNYINECVLAKSFNNVFEDMIDQLISDNKLTSLKKNKDGKIIDHLYTDNSLINNGNVYFIADSKYYKDSSDLGETAVYKQFTYARNIIQHNLNLYQKNPSDKNYLPAMRDELTDGYNIVPNYFIRGSVIDSDGNLYNYEDDGLINEFDKDHKASTSKLVNFHFQNRLFDRDTMVLQTYNINFIYVVAKYIEGEDEIVKAEIHKKFREDLINRFDNLYQFYILKPISISTTLEDALNMHFRQLAGKVIHPFKDADYLILALEKCENGNTETKLTKVSIKENDELLKNLEEDFCVLPSKLNEL
ncbi:MAG: LlaJI family restriction endonuclease [Bacteroidales bacterium]|nr:LlaJI family restriction endonuclease [Bacteroidales bacterium]